MSLGAVHSKKHCIRKRGPKAGKLKKGFRFPLGGKCTAAKAKPARKSRRRSR